VTQQEMFSSTRLLSAAVQEAHDTVERARKEHQSEAVFLLLSGGNDSMVLLDAMVEHADAVVHINTGIGIPEVADFAKKQARSIGGPPVFELHPPTSYEELVLGLWRGMPGPGAHRYTYQRLKERCVRRLLTDHRSRPGQRFLLLSGVRAAESKRRMGYHLPVHRNGGQVWVNPLHHWSNEEMARYRFERRLPQSEVAANLHMSGECLCGAMADQGPEREERALIRFFYPDFDKRLCGLEEECRRRGLPYCEWGVKRPDLKKKAEVDGQQVFMPMCVGCEGRSGAAV
jgi:3'-phosphoadenosine 5'-phosphosulfate sulfotransferase (PAPS reductase)/FAD synthetase